MRQFDDSGREGHAGGAELEREIFAHMRHHPERVSRLETQGRFVWIKRPETPGPLRRIQKGDPRTAFERERLALHLLGAEGAPVPRLLSEGKDYLAVADSGTPLHRIMKDGAFSEEERNRCFAQAGRELAALHERHFSHGRPSLRDICWRDGRITFLDFERFSARRNTPHGHMQDVVMFVFSAFAASGGPRPEIDAAISAYRAADPGGIWNRAVGWCRRWRWIGTATKPVRLLRSSPEFAAIPLTLRAFLDSG